MKTELSILIPTFNDRCTALVSQLSAQAEQIKGLTYEIIIADDGSTDAEVVKENQQLSAIEHCKLYRYETNRGRAAIRNALVEFAAYPWLLFIDSGHMRLCSDDYLRKYLSVDDIWQVVYGGYCLAALPTEEKGCNLRYKYELRAKQNASAERRKKSICCDFHSSNFLIHKDAIRYVQFDERFVRYGYEDVLFGKDLRLQGTEIYHIDNPTLFCGYEDNSTFLRKTMEGLQTLKEFEDELRDCSRLIRAAQQLQRCGLAGLFRYYYHHKKAEWTATLEGQHPSVHIFNLFRLGYYLDL